MLFAVDVGNTNLTFGVFQGDRLTHSFRMATRRDITSDEIGLYVMQFFRLNGLEADKVEDVVITSVVPQIMYSLSGAMRRYLGREPLVVGDNLAPGVVNKYENPREVGADRLVNAAGAYAKYGGPLIVIDFGTATTFDAVDAEGAYLGGAIVPGIKISMNALFEHASKLPRVEILDPKIVIGRNTVESIQAGLFYGNVGTVMHIVDKMKEVLGPKTQVVATGGLAGMFTSGAAHVDVVDRNITLEGLLLIYKKSRA